MTDESTGGAARWNNSHNVTTFLNGFASAPPQSRMAMSLGELATSCDSAGHGQPTCMAICGVESSDKAAIAAAGVAALWGRWGARTCLIDLASGKDALQGALNGTNVDLATACNGALERGSIGSMSVLHSSITGASVISAGSSDVIGLISTGRLAKLVAMLKQSHDRIVMCAPSLASGFPFLSLNQCCDCLVVALVRGRTRGGAVREVAEQAMRAGLPPVDAIWFD